jgi:hypothetical protein
VLDAPGVLTYDWSVAHNSQAVPYTMEAADNSQIGFLVPTTGAYDVSVQIGGSAQCTFEMATLNVLDPNGVNGYYRLRAVPSSSAPPQESVVLVHGGTAMYERDIALDPGLPAAGTVRNGASGPGIAAYVKFAPVSAPLAYTETFSSGSGAYSVRLLGQMHDVIVIPQSTALAPKKLAWTPQTTSLVVGAGTLVSGTVRDPAGTGITGAKVQLYADGVPSTVGTTAAGGAFSLRADFPAQAQITVKVTPPNASGLPRLEAIGAFDLAQAMQINYAATLQRCDVGGSAVKRGGANQPGAKVTIVGAVPGTSATVTTGAVSANAVGTARVSITANGSGVLPAAQAPRAALAAVVQLAMDDWSVDTLDTTTTCAQTIDALAPTTVMGTLEDMATAGLEGARVEATPIGALALADAVPVSATATTGGGFSITLAAGGQYDVRYVDPLTRAAPLVRMAIAPAAAGGTVTLPKATKIYGEVTVVGSPNPVVGASVQMLCATCAGIDATRPVAQTATDTLGNYAVAVPDPGTM